MKAQFVELCRIGPSIGCHPDPDKSSIITYLYNLDIATSLFQENGFNITTGIRYIGGFIGSEEDANNYIWVKVEQWVNSVGVFSHI